MPAPKVGSQVWDKVTSRLATILHSSAQKEDGQWTRYYELADVPLSPNYPTGWRHQGEIAIKGPSSSPAL